MRYYLKRAKYKLLSRYYGILIYLENKKIIKPKWTVEEPPPSDMSYEEVDEDFYDWARDRI